MTNEELAKLPISELKAVLEQEAKDVTKGNSYSQLYWRAYEELESRKQH